MSPSAMAPLKPPILADLSLSLFLSRHLASFAGHSSGARVARPTKVTAAQRCFA